MATAFAVLASIGATAASAAEPPRDRDTAPGYVRVCDAFGAGFFVFPGTDTCLRISGYARYEMRLRSTASRSQDGLRTFVRGVFDIDARTRSDWGLVRSFASLRNNSQTPSSVTGAASERTYLDQAFVQFGPLVAGLKASYFDFVDGYEHDWEIIGLTNGNSDHKANMLAYTWQVGKSLSITASVEDPTNVRLGIGNAGYGGQRMPDLVGSVRYTDSWGQAMLSGVAHSVTSGTPGIASETGYAMQASIRVFLPMLAKGDSLVLSGSVADGATRYVMTSLSGNDVNDKSGTLTNISPVINDAYQIGGALRTVRSAAVFTALQHYWTPAILTNVYGSYAVVDNPISVPNVRIWNAGAVLFFNPTSQLRFGPEIVYQNVQVSALGRTRAQKGDDWRATFRVNRSF